MQTIIPCPFCRTQVAIGGICPKCGVGIPGDGPVATYKTFRLNKKPKREPRIILNQIRIS